MFLTAEFISYLEYTEGSELADHRRRGSVFKRFAEARECRKIVHFVTVFYVSELKKKTNTLELARTHRLALKGYFKRSRPKALLRWTCYRWSVNIGIATTIKAT